MHCLSLCALGHNTGSDVCASSECPGETAFAQACLSCQCLHNKLVYLISWHVLQIALAILCQKKPIFARYQSIFYANYSEKILKTSKMYMKTLIYLISRIRYLIIAVKGKKIAL